MKKHRTFLITLSISAFLLIIVYTVIGTTIAHATILYGIFGNLIVGSGEGLLFSMVYRIPRRKGIPRMILANYFAFAGILVFTLLLRNRGMDTTIYNGWKYLIVATILSGLVFFLIKAFFVFYNFRHRSYALWRTLRASVSIELPLYLIICLWYIPACTIGIYTESVLEESMNFIKEPNWRCYYISPEDSSIKVIFIDNGKSELVYSDSFPETARLVLQVSKSYRSFDLYFRYPQNDTHEKRLVAENIGRIPDHIERYNDLDTYYANVTELRPENQRFRQALSGSGRFKGLRIVAPTNGRTSARFPGSDNDGFTIALHTPFLSWPVRCATIIPGDQIIFEMGKQICLFDPDERKLALIARGRCPVVVRKGT